MCVSEEDSELQAAMKQTFTNSCRNFKQQDVSPDEIDEPLDVSPVAFALLGSAKGDEKWYGKSEWIFVSHQKQKREAVAAEGMEPAVKTRQSCKLQGIDDGLSVQLRAEMRA